MPPSGGERELCWAPYLRRGAARECAPGRAAARGGERSPGRCPAARREGARSSPARSPSRLLPPVSYSGLRWQNAGPLGKA